MKAPVFDINAKQIEEITLSSSFFGAKVNDDLIAQAVRVYLANQRKSHAKSKERSEVSGTTKKMWAQKGTGRARHSSAKAPQFVGGGKAHGPSGDQNYSLTMSKKMRVAALKSVLTKFAANSSIIVIDGLDKIEPKTKVAWALMDKLEKEIEALAKSRKIGIISSETISSVKRAFGNIPGLNLINLKSINTHDIANQNFLIFTKEAVSALK